MTRFFFVQVIQTGRKEPRRVPRPKRAAPRAPLEMPWQQAIEVALDELDINAVGDKPVTRESVPFFADAKREVQLFDG